LVFVLKSLIPIFAVLLALQGLAQLIRSGLVLAGRGEGAPER
jgi:TRAP-type mannitol/chloroaromatic compound transport system permease small subunit